MLRKLARVDAPPALVREHYLDLAAWPEWVPTIESVRVLEVSPERRVAEFRRLSMGRRSTQTMEFLLRPQGYRERQLEGQMARWEADWEFRPLPEGDGTVVAMRLDVEMKGLASLAPKRTVYRYIGRAFDRMAANTERRLRARLEAAGGAAANRREEELTVRVYQTGDEVEIEIGGRRFVGHAVD